MEAASRSNPAEIRYSEGEHDQWLAVIAKTGFAFLGLIEGP